jgi:hypothetical protein
MLYDLSNQLQAKSFITKAELLSKRGGIVELTEKKARRSGQQNRYLHVCLGYFACETGNTLEYVKQKYFKTLCNPDIFIREMDDKYLGHIKILRSSSDLDTAEMATAIERFRNWCAGEAGIYIPSADEERLIQLMEIEVDRAREFV